MNRLALNLIVRHRVTRCILQKTTNQQQLLMQQSCKITEKKTSNVNKEEENFGVSSKYARLDSAKLVVEGQTINNNEKRVNMDSVTSSDKFNNNYLDDIEYHSKIGYRKPLSEIATNLNDNVEQEEIEEKYDKILKHKPLSNDPNEKSNTEYFYARKIQKLCQQKKYKEAIYVFFVEMMEKDRFKPTMWLYKVMMLELAYIGDIEMVFSLFKRLIGSHDQEWKLRKNKTLFEKIITIMFTACARSNDKELVINKCNSIRKFLRNKGIEMNKIHYVSAISAYGRSGAIYEAFNLVDEMLEEETVASTIRKRLLSVDVINNLLCACISQPEYGFRYALMTWQMCLTYKLRPTLTTYELLLRAAKDCSMCSRKELVKLKETTRKDLKSSQLPVDGANSTSKLISESNQDTPTMVSIADESKLDNHSSESSVEKKSDENDSIIELKSENVSIIDEFRLAGEELEKEVKNLEWWQDIKTSVNRENLLRAVSKIRPELKEIILARNFDSILTRKLDEAEQDSLFEFVTHEDDSPPGRLFMCTGGLDGLLIAMKAHSVKPNLRIFQLLSRIVSEDVESENELIEKMKDLQIKPDIDFINALIRRRAFRGQKTEVDNAFNMIQKEQLTPTIHTFGGLAYCVETKEDLSQFLDNLKSFNFNLNHYMLSAMLLRAYHRKDLIFTKHLLEYISENNIRVNRLFIDKINRYLYFCKKYLIQYEKSSSKHDEKETKFYERTRNFYNSLSEYFPIWIKNVKKDRR